MCWGCVLHVSTPLSSTAPGSFRPWSFKEGHHKGMWVHVSLQWGACYIQTLCEWCHMLYLWMLCHQLWPSWVAKSNGELYSVTCRLPLFVGTHEPSFIVTLNAQGVNMACFWLKSWSLRTCFLKVVNSQTTLLYHWNTTFCHSKCPLSILSFSLQFTVHSLAVT